MKLLSLKGIAVAFMTIILSGQAVADMTISPMIGFSLTTGGRFNVSVGATVMPKFQKDDTIVPSASFGIDYSTAHSKFRGFAGIGATHESGLTGLVGIVSPLERWNGSMFYRVGLTITK